MRVLYILVLTAALLSLAIDTSSAGLLSAVLAILPVVAWFYFFCARKENNQTSKVANSFVCLAIAYAVSPIFVGIGDFLGEPIARLVSGDQLGWFVLRAGVIEELAKFCAVFILARIVNPHAIRHPVDGMVLGAAAGLGFALHENFFHNVYLLEQSAGTAFQFFLLGALVRVPLHCLYSSIWGAAFAASRFMNGNARFGFPVVALVFTAFLHGLWDTTAQHSGAAAWLLTIFFAGMWFMRYRLKLELSRIKPAIVPGNQAQ
jgi:RsiW-degrading membrane proteinase PrsW (M82 family)